MPRRHRIGGLADGRPALAFAQLRTRAAVYAATVERLTRAGVTRVRRGGVIERRPADRLPPSTAAAAQSRRTRNPLARASTRPLAQA